MYERMYFSVDKAIVFITGVIGYPITEILWRGHTHWTMAVTGGICFLLIYLASGLNPSVNIFFQSIISAVIITTVEFLIGVIVNLTFGMNVWDYSNLPFNLLGQVCLIYFFLWFLLSIPLVPLCRLLRNRLKH